jgi:hypothetical protein
VVLESVFSSQTEVWNLSPKANVTSAEANQRINGKIFWKVLPFERNGGPQITVTELLFEKKELISGLQQLLIGTHRLTRMCMLGTSEKWTLQLFKSGLLGIRSNGKIHFGPFGYPTKCESPENY